MYAQQVCRMSPATRGSARSACCFSAISASKVTPVVRLAGPASTPSPSTAWSPARKGGRPGCAPGSGRRARIALAIACGIQARQRFDRFFEGAVAALQVGVALAVVGAGSRRSRRRARRATPAGRGRGPVSSSTVRLQRSITCLPRATHCSTRDSGSADSARAPAAGDVDHLRFGPIQRREAQLDRFAVHHLVGAGRGRRRRGKWRQVMLQSLPTLIWEDVDPGRGQPSHSLRKKFS